MRRKSAGRRTKRQGWCAMGKDEFLNSKPTEWPFERKCPECGKVFSGRSLDDWAFKDKGTYICSWKCFRAREMRANAETMELERKARELGRLKPAQKMELIRMYRRKRLNESQISQATGLSWQAIHYYWRKIEGENG